MIFPVCPVLIFIFASGIKTKLLTALCGLIFSWELIAACVFLTNRIQMFVLAQKYWKSTWSRRKKIKMKEDLRRKKSTFLSLQTNLMENKALSEYVSLIEPLPEKSELQMTKNCGFVECRDFVSGTSLEKKWQSWIHIRSRRKFLTTKSAIWDCFWRHFVSNWTP